MGIDVAMVTERSEVILEVLGPRQCLATLALGPWQQLDQSCCVRFVDPFGDTTFNQAQLAELLSELELSKSLAREPEVLDHLEKVCNLVKQAQQKGAHIYVKFIGD